jgi:hypothetical protein
MGITQEAGTQRLNRVNGPVIGVVLFQRQYLQEQGARDAPINPCGFALHFPPTTHTSYRAIAPAPEVPNVRQIRMMDPLRPSNSAVQAAV